jgi:hypothetical protein
MLFVQNVYCPYLADAREVSCAYITGYNAGYPVMQRAMRPKSQSAVVFANLIHLIKVAKQAVGLATNRPLPELVG